MGRRALSGGSYHGTPSYYLIPNYIIQEQCAHVKKKMKYFHGCVGVRAYVKGKRAIKIKNSWNLNGILLFAGKKRDFGLGIPWGAGRFFIF